jgi:hypothetical protein
MAGCGVALVHDAIRLNIDLLRESRLSRHQPPTNSRSRELLKQAVPRLTTFAYIHDPTIQVIQRSSVDASIDAGAAKLGLKKIDMPLHNPDPSGLHNDSGA